MFGCFTSLKYFPLLDLLKRKCLKNNIFASLLILMWHAMEDNGYSYSGYSFKFAKVHSAYNALNITKHYKRKETKAI